MKTPWLKPFLIANLFWLLIACASSSYHITSIPDGASIYYNDPATNKRFLMGLTPISYSKSSLPNDRPFLVSVEKDGYLNQELPIAPTDGSRTLINVKLKPDPDGSKKDSAIVNHTVQSLFKAQSLIYHQRFQAAIVELNVLLEEHPNLIQALVMRGTAFYLLNDMASAISDWKKVMAIDRNNEELQNFLIEKNIRLN